MSERALRVALIGCGGRGLGHARHIAAIDGAMMAAVCDPDAERCSAAAAELGGAATYTATERMLEAESPDAVVVAVPAEFNAPVAQICLEAGVDTLVEKPPGLHVAETRRLQEAAERTGAHCMVGLNRRFNPAIREARRLVCERGPLTTIVGEFHKNLVDIEARRIVSEPVLERYFYETPLHALDCVRAMADSPVADVHSFSGRAFSRHRDVYGAIILFESGCVAHLIANVTAGARLERYELHGNGASAYLEGIRSGQVVIDGQVTELVDPGDRSTTGDRSTGDQNRYFVECVRDRLPFGPPACDLNEAIASMELVERMFG